MSSVEATTGISDASAKESGWYRDPVTGQRLNHRTHDAKDGSKTMSQLAREENAWRERQPVTTRCNVYGCEWTHEGTATEGRVAFGEHRRVKHPTAERARTGLNQREQRAQAEAKAERRRQTSAAREAKREAAATTTPVRLDRKPHEVADLELAVRAPAAAVCSDKRAALLREIDEASAEMQAAIARHTRAVADFAAYVVVAALERAA